MTKLTTKKTNLLYLIGTFPTLSETFIQREIIELLRDKGLNARVISFRRGDESIPLPPELKSKIVYFSPRPLKILASNVVEFFRSPIKYLGLVRLILFGKHNRLYLKIVDIGSLLVGASLSSEIRNLDIDHIHTHFATWPTTIALVLSKFLDIPFSFTAHASDIYERQMLLKEKISLAKAVVTISAFNQNYLRDLVSLKDRRKISLVYLGVNFRDLHFYPKRKTNEVPNILAIGRLVPKKGFKYLVEALYLTKMRRIKFKAFIVGGGSEFATLKSMVEDKDLEKNVSLLGALPFEEVMQHLGNADILVAPSVVVPNGDIDGIPVVLFEAMSAKLPIVSTHISGIPEAVKDKENGLLIEEKDTEALADAIYTLLNDQDLRERFGEAGFRRAQKMFDIHKNVQHLKQVILG